MERKLPKVSAASPEMSCQCDRKFACILVSITFLINITVVALAVVIAIFPQIPQLEASIEQFENFEMTLLEASMRLTRNISVSQNEIEYLASTLNSSGLLPNFPAASCTAILQFDPSSPSNHYWIRSSNGSAVRVYCDMTRSCGGVTGGWIRVVELDMSQRKHECPPGFQNYTFHGRRRCRVTNPSPSCTSAVLYALNSIFYSKVCGSIKGYQIYLTNGFGGRNLSPSEVTLDSNYVDGIILKHGNRVQQHIWTFAAAQCSTGQCDAPGFVGGDYFCDGFLNCLDMSCRTSTLWDGDGCGDNTCCYRNNPPLFHKQLPESTTDNIEMTLCRDDHRYNKDIEFEFIEIYVQ